MCVCVCVCVCVNGHHNTEFRFVDLEHAEFCLESAIHDISCHLSGNHVVRFSVETNHKFIIDYCCC